MVRAFQNPVEAFQESAMEDFDLIVTDIRMPHIDGFETIRYIREVRREQGKSRVPEILITGYAAEHEDETKSLNPHAIIHKPFDVQDFIDIVNNTLREWDDQASQDSGK